MEVFGNSRMPHPRSPRRNRGYYRNNWMGKILGGVDGHVSVVHRGVSVCC
jgi:hypothetical protein